MPCLLTVLLPTALLPYNRVTNRSQSIKRLALSSLVLLPSRSIAFDQFVEHSTSSSACGRSSGGSLGRSLGRSLGGCLGRCLGRSLGGSPSGILFRQDTVDLELFFFVEFLGKKRVHLQGRCLHDALLPGRPGVSSVDRVGHVALGREDPSLTTP